MRCDRLAAARSRGAGMRSLFAFLPGAGYVIGLILFWRFGLDESEHARIREELDRRTP